jgi:Ca2+-binding EF-hand superfamily protein
MTSDSRGSLGSRGSRGSLRMIVTRKGDGEDDDDDDEHQDVEASALEPEVPHERPPTREVSARNRVNHLGVPLYGGRPTKFRYARTYTVLFDKANIVAANNEKQWRLLRDAVVVVDHSVPALRSLFRIFQSFAPTNEHSMISAKDFRLALEQHGVNDRVLVQRLFSEFCEREGERALGHIDFRHFIRALATMNAEPIEERVELLFEVWDADGSGTLSHQELSEHVVHDLPVHRRQGAMAAFNAIWTQLRSFAAKENVNEWIKNELTKDNLVDACMRMPAVRTFLTTMLTRQPPAADSNAMRGVHSLRARMRELDGEVQEEFKYMSLRDMKRAEAAAAPAAQPKKEAQFDERSVRAATPDRKRPVTAAAADKYGRELHEFVRTSVYRQNGGIPQRRGAVQEGVTLPGLQRRTLSTARASWR